MGKRCGLLWGISIMAFLLAGCGDRAQNEVHDELAGGKDTIAVTLESEDSGAEIPGEDDKDSQDESTDAERIAEICRDICAQAARDGTLGSIETIGRMVARLGENGYAAASGDNQVDMAGAEQVLEFVRAVEEKESRRLTIVAVMGMGLRIFDLETRDGDVTVVRSYYQYDREGILQERSTVSYPADFWEYTPEGYLIFAGKSLLPETFVMTFSATAEHTALRVLPLEESCRELNRKYLLPVGYERNNVFLCSWSGEEYGNLDFYDVFDRFYPILRGRPHPYGAEGSPGEESAYWIPEEEFESVITAFFDIDRETLRRKTEYSPEQAAYKYRPRGFHEAEYPDIPYPEVVGWRENGDGTITLTVNAVYPHDDTSRAFTHETVIRPLDGERFQYVSNRMLSEEGEYDPWWHSDRSPEEAGALTAED